VIIRSACWTEGLNCGELEQSIRGHQAGMEPGNAFIGPNLSLAETDLGFQFAMKDLDFPTIQVRLDERLSGRDQIRGDEVGGLIIFQFPGTGRTIGRGHDDDEA